MKKRANQAAYYSKRRVVLAMARLDNFKLSVEKD